MPIWNILILTGIVAAFVLFGVMLAWANHQTRHLKVDPEQGERESAEQPELKKAA